MDNFTIMLATGMVMFFIGLYGLVSKDSAVKSVMAIEILVASVNINLIAFGFAQAVTADPQAQTFVIFSLSIGGAVIGLAIAVLLNVRRQYGTIQLSKVKDLKW